MKISLQQALKRLPGAATPTYPQGAPFVTMMAGGTMSVEVFAPVGEDMQQPHTQDELYFVQRGHAQLIINGQVYEAAPADVFFVAAGAEHRFINFSTDFATWVVFYGPQGGE
jgi:mannose-6-phosphate isomerase-like protein (cupin superfamily)